MKLNLEYCKAPQYFLVNLIYFFKTSLQLYLSFFFLVFNMYFCAA
jgi:hypothetical protein